jgi:hypothetical protein
MLNKSDGFPFFCKSGGVDMSVFVLQGIETLASLTLVETIEKKAPGNNQGRQAKG